MQEAVCRWSDEHDVQEACVSGVMSMMCRRLCVGG